MQEKKRPTCILKMEPIVLFGDQTLAYYYFFIKLGQPSVTTRLKDLGPKSNCVEFWDQNLDLGLDLF